MSWPGPGLQRLQLQVPFSWIAWAFQVKEFVSPLSFHGYGLVVACFMNGGKVYMNVTFEDWDGNNCPWSP